MTPPSPIVLASASPRRRQLIHWIVDDVDFIATDSDESFDPACNPDDIAGDLASRKAVAGFAERPGTLVIAADTIVVCDHEVMNKPDDEHHAREMLRLLSGRGHTVFTGIATAGPDVGCLRRIVTSAEVWFRDLRDADIDAYLATDVWVDKAGAYGIQGNGGLIVERVVGCFQAVVGFPLCTVARLLREQGVVVKREPPPCGLRSVAHCHVWPGDASGASQPAVDRPDNLDPP